MHACGQRNHYSEPMPRRTLRIRYRAQAHPRARRYCRNRPSNWVELFVACGCMSCLHWQQAASPTVCIDQRRDGLSITGRRPAASLAEISKCSEARRICNQRERSGPLETPIAVGLSPANIGRSRLRLEDGDHAPLTCCVRRAAHITKLAKPRLSYLRCRGGIRRQVSSTIRANTTYERVNTQAGRS